MARHAVLVFVRWLMWIKFYWNWNYVYYKNTILGWVKLKMGINHRIWRIFYFRYLIYWFTFNSLFYWSLGLHLYQSSSLRNLSSFTTDCITPTTMWTNCQSSAADWSYRYFTFWKWVENGMCPSIIQMMKYVLFSNRLAQRTLLIILPEMHRWSECKQT